MLPSSVSSRRLVLSRPMNTVVVTGAGSGVGQAISQKFATEGWAVALVGRRAAGLEKTAVLIPGAARERVASFVCDVSDAAAVEAMGGAVLERFGEVDVLVNSAGI